MEIKIEKKMVILSVINTGAINVENNSNSRRF